jgi:hypothetical protein
VEEVIAIGKLFEAATHVLYLLYKMQEQENQIKAP